MVVEHVDIVSKISIFIQTALTRLMETGNGAIAGMLALRGGAVQTLASIASRLAWKTLASKTGRTD
jgi:hypothetical protein